jgi:hypothetical protein
LIQWWWREHEENHKEHQAHFSHFVGDHLQLEE